jgi:CRP/FNR family transcriptional regulator
VTVKIHAQMAEKMLPDVIQKAREIVLPSGQHVFIQGQQAENFILVTHGCIKVYARSRTGKEVILYRVKEEETCILTTTCLLGHSRYPAEATTECETLAKVIPSNLFAQLLNDAEPFRQFVFEGLSMRLAQVMERFEYLTLESVHQRLTDFLLRRADSEGVVEITHELLAVEIGTVREVVSRHLSAMEKDGSIIARRGRIEILQPQALS